MSFKPEQELVLLLSQVVDRNPERAQHLMTRTLDWCYVLGHLLYNRTAAIAHWSLSQSLARPRNFEVNTCLRAVFEHQARRIDTMLPAALEIGSHLENEGVKHAFLKGTILWTTIYPRGTRSSQDIDVLVPSSELGRCGDVLRDLGYVQGSYDPSTNSITPASRNEIIRRRMTTGETAEFVKIAPSGPEALIVDVNHSLDWIPAGSRSSVSDFIERSILIPVEQGQIRSLPKEEFLIHLCIHLFKEARVYNWVESQRDLLLYKFVDIFTYARTQDIDWERFLVLSTEHNLCDGAYVAFKYTKDLLGACAPEELVEALRPNNSTILDEVIDPATQRSYRWTRSLRERFFELRRTSTYLKRQD